MEFDILQATIAIWAMKCPSESVSSTREIPYEMRAVLLGGLSEIKELHQNYIKQGRCRSAFRRKVVTIVHQYAAEYRDEDSRKVTKFVVYSDSQPLITSWYRLVVFPKNSR